MNSKKAWGWPWKREAKYEPISYPASFPSLNELYRKMYEERRAQGVTPLWSLDRTGVPILEIGGQIFRVKKHEFLASLSQMLSMAGKLESDDDED